MDCRESSYYRMVLNQNVTRQGTAIRKNNVVFHHAIMRDMAVCEKIAPITHPRNRTRGGRTIHRNKFAETVSFSDLKESRFTRIFQILRLLADRTKSMESISCPNPYRPTNSHMILKPTIGSDRYLCADNTIRTNRNTRSNLSFGIDHRGRMNAH
jgi:hypothetical protein